MTLSDTRSALDPAVLVPGQTCAAMSDILNRIGDKWSVMVVAHLGHTPTMRFSELRRAVDGISQRMLTLTLRNLERDGLVDRTIYAQVPPRVEYRLTRLGQTLLGPINALWDWAGAHGEDIATARARYDARRAEEGRRAGAGRLSRCP